MSYSDEYFCPNCGAILNDQDGFDPDEGTWTCTDCGQSLYGDDLCDGNRYPGVLWYCDECGALLNKQDGFADFYDSWICTECGHTNGISEDEIDRPSSSGSVLDTINSVLDLAQSGIRFYAAIKGIDLDEGDSESRDESSDFEDEYDDDDENDDEDDDEDEDEYEIENYSYTNDYRDRVDYSANNTSSGIKREDPIPSATIYLDDHFTTETTKKNSFGWVILAILLPIIICTGLFYLLQLFSEEKDHSGEIRLSYSSSSYNSMHYYDAIVRLYNQGLKNIRLTPLADLKTGLLTKEGQVDSVEINSNSDFQNGDWVKEDSIVRIVYHAFPQKVKKGFDEKNNQQIVLNRVELFLPEYFIEKEHTENILSFYSKGDENTTLVIQSIESRNGSDLSEYDTSFVLSDIPIKTPNVKGNTIVVLAKRDNQIFRIVITEIEKNETEWIRLILTSPNNSRTDYTIDYEAIINHIFIPADTDIQILFTSKQLKGKNVDDVVSMLGELGFTNVRTEEIKDVVTGWIDKVGSVDSVSVDSSTSYDSGIWCDRDVQIIVTYHAKK